MLLRDDWIKVEIPEARSIDGDVRHTMRNALFYEEVIGDNFRNLAVELIEKFLENKKEPNYGGVVKYGHKGPHPWVPDGEEIIKLFEEHIEKFAPNGEDTSKWKY